MSDHSPGSEPSPLDESVVERLAGVERLLVASDFDGVLAPLVDDPACSIPLSGSIEALARLAATADTAVAIVSGRERRQLQAMVPDPDRFTLVGSHGAEIEDTEPDPDDRRRLDELTGRLDALGADCPGFHVETKTLSVAAHFRRITDAADRRQVTATVSDLRQAWPGKVVEGKEVVEFTIATATKGDAVRILSERTAATATVYLGDDVTDEDAFTVLGPADVGIKVGPGPTAATHRVDAPPSVIGFLERLAELRQLHRR